MSLAPFLSVTGRAALLPRANLDTDVIIRVERLTTTDDAALAKYAFEPLRYRDDGSEDPDFVLNHAAFRGAPILIGGANFGCGSSREPAVWALRGLGIRCVIAPSFGDIFYGNCLQNGLLAIALGDDAIATLSAAAAAGRTMTVDLTQQRLVTTAGDVIEFFVSPPLRRSLLDGLDALELSLKDAARVAAFEARDRKARPWARPERR